MVGARIVEGKIWVKSKACLGWLVGWLCSIPPSFLFDREEGIAGCIYSSSSYYQERKPPGENVQQACDIGLRGRLLVCIYTANKTEQNSQKIRYGAMHKVMIGFVFPIGK